MMTKRDKVQKILKIDGTVFYKSWEKVPETMIKKLNAKEIAEYMKQHIIPKVQKSILDNQAYKPESKARQPRLLGVA
jgi:hypothetical protein